MASLKIGLNIQSKTREPAKATPGKTKPIFGEPDSDDDEAPAKKSNGFEEINAFDEDVKVNKFENNPSKIPKSSVKPKTTKTKPSIAGGIDLSTLRVQQQRGQDAVDLDPNIYDYDAAYDAIHAKSAAKKAAERADAEERRPKYMTSLLEAAEVRKRDQLRAQDKLLQREREAEGDDFADKEKFVTEAYKEQQEQVRRMAEEERKREEKEGERRNKTGMSGFYRSVMEEEEKKHQAAMQAAAEGQLAGATVRVEPEEKTAAQLAREMNEQGANILINDEGQVADKRQLLVAGLNVVPKPKSTATSSAKNDAQIPRTTPGFASRTVGSRHAMRDRQTKMIAAQLEQAAKRAADLEEGEREKLERAAKSQKTEHDVSSARERYLQRKRDAATAAAAEPRTEITR